MKKLALLSVISLALPSGVQAAMVTPTAVSVKVYRVAVSSSKDCSNPGVVINNGDSPSYVDFLTTPSVGDGSIGNGTYPCIIIEMSDQVKWNATCAGSEQTQDVCDGGTVDTIEGGTATCTSGDDKVTVWLSTGSSTAGDGFRKPANEADSTNGFQLDNALEVSGDIDTSFVVNFTNKLDDSTCNNLEPPSWGFKKN